jgi:ferredoxin
MTGVIDLEGLDALLDALMNREFNLIGPTVRDGAIIYDDIHSTRDLPRGWTDHQQPAAYRLNRNDRDTLFEFVVGPQSWKSHLFPPRERLYQVTRSDAGLVLHPDKPADRKIAFVGVRACELAAIALQDKVFIRGPFLDTHYGKRRKEVFLLAVNCARAAETCFCTSMKTGPDVQPNAADITLTEFADDAGLRFLAESGSEIGLSLLSEIPHREAVPDDFANKERLIENTKSQIKRSIDTNGVKELLQDNPNHPRWDEVAKRCLSCANCTMVCPTCFCSNVEDTTDLTGDHAERWRQWDSCFTMDFSHIHGGSIRPSTKSRYRQWMTHKLANWQDQFDQIGCVGCGRCITWCPVGIDITEEVTAIRHSAASTDSNTEDRRSTMERNHEHA